MIYSIFREFLLIFRETIKGLDKESIDLLRESINQTNEKSKETPSVLRAKPKLVPISFYEKSVDKIVENRPNSQMVNEKPKEKHKKDDTEQVINAVFRRLKRFDKRQLDKLMRMLDKIEHEKQENSLSISSNKNKQISAKNEIIIIVKNNWGNPYFAGFTEIQFLDKNNEIIEISNFYTKNNEINNTENMQKILLSKNDGNTIEENKMWYGKMPPKPYFLELVFELKNEVQKIKVWNFNSPRDLDYGLKDIEILYNNEMIWKGEIKKSYGKIDENYCQEISFSNFKEIQENTEKSIKNLIDISEFSIFDYKSKFSSIPILPECKILIFTILSTWGDQNFVGLNGIEIFDSDGKPIKILPDQILLYKISSKMEYSMIENSVNLANIVSEPFLTKNDQYAWVFEFPKNEKLQIQIMLPEGIAISMIRIWNYNKSRIYALRGIKDLLISGDKTENIFFDGEISKGPGEIGNLSNCCETILFCEDTQILEKIQENDWIDIFDNKISELASKSTENLSRPVTVNFKPFENDEKKLDLGKIDICELENFDVFLYIFK